MSEEREINRNDYLRIMLLLEAYEVALAESGIGLEPHLHHIYEWNDEPPPDDITGDAWVARERWHARLTLDALFRGEPRIPATIRSPLTVCAEPGCPELTHGTYCLTHELEHGR